VTKLSVNSSSDFAPTKIPNGFTFEIKTSKTEVDLNENIYLTKNSSSGSGDGSLTPPPSPVI
ncbi:MAG: hypothetical protein LUG16_02190, partial [Candidatus Gastranaerophilales bacterium]|nr:hypothetical protein [Candidatus Gastranaerophilales bacterium]